MRDNSSAEKESAFLKCAVHVLASPDESNIKTIPHMRELFGCEVGLSDHTLGIGVAVASVAMGATIIEKHFTLNRSDGGMDSAFSLEPAEMAMLLKETEIAWRSLGKVAYGPTDSEKDSLVFRRSLYITKDLKAGDVLTKDNVRAIRPGYGLAPKLALHLIGRKISHDTLSGTPLSWDLF